MSFTAVEALRRLGGTAQKADLLRLTTVAGVRAAERRGQVQRISRGVYALPDAGAEQRAAAAAHGVISHQSAAAYWLMESMREPGTRHVTVPRNARPAPAKGVTRHYGPVEDEKVTAPLRTVLDCAKSLPFREALAIADSACRRTLVTPDELLIAADRLRGRGRQRALRVAAQVDGRAENPFESGLRGILIEAGITGFQPQLVIPDARAAVANRSGAIRVDLGDPERMIVLEADSFTYHGSPQALERDCRRYDELISRGWLVLRFSYDQVMCDPAWVAEVVLRTYALRDSRTARTARARRSR